MYNNYVQIATHTHIHTHTHTYAHIKQQPKAGKATKQIPDQQIYQSPTNVRTKENIAVHSTVS